MTPASPCIQVCRLDPRTGLCEGCLRTADEIACWPTASDDAKHAILRALKGRTPPEPTRNPS